VIQSGPAVAGRNIVALSQGRVKALGPESAHFVESSLLGQSGVDPDGLPPAGLDQLPGRDMAGPYAHRLTRTMDVTWHLAEIFSCTRAMLAVNVNA
jgi:hypothetical protein